VTHLDPSIVVISHPEMPEKKSSPLESVKVSKPSAGRRGLWKLVLRGVVVSSLLGVTWAGWAGWKARSWRGQDPILQLPKVSVSKADLSTIVNTWGRVESSHNTIIACELERLEMRSEGKTVTSGGASTILSLIPEGTEVKKGDVLCQLDGSDYEELVRTQEIKTLQSAAALRQAELSLEVAEIAVREYREGLYIQNLQNKKGLITLAQSDLERAADRFRWTETMLQKGYLPVSKKTEAKQTLDQFEFDLQSYQFDLKNYLKYGDGRQKMDLDAEVEKRRFEVIANTQRVTRSNERLAHYKRMLDFCTIRAPHDGFLIYAIDPSRPSSLPIEEGQTVRQSQKLFYLPDLGNMEVFAYLHESVARQVHEGMRARAKIEGINNRELEGHVVSIAPLPTTAGNWISDEVKYFVSVVKLDSVPKGLRPGMSAEVEFDVDRCFDVLAIPSEAIAVEQGHNVCYVAGVDGLERRSVTLGRSNRELLEVTRGLSEGEQVVLRPEKIESIDSMVVHTSEKDATGESSGTAEGFTGGTAPVTVD
jgi:HlyD family secretion protein